MTHGVIAAAVVAHAEQHSQRTQRRVTSTDGGWLTTSSAAQAVLSDVLRHRWPLTSGRWSTIFAFSSMSFIVPHLSQFHMASKYLTLSHFISPVSTMKIPTLQTSLLFIHTSSSSSSSSSSSYSLLFSALLCSSLQLFTHSNWSITLFYDRLFWFQAHERRATFPDRQPYSFGSNCKRQLLSSLFRSTRPSDCSIFNFISIFALASLACLQ